MRLALACLIAAVFAGCAASTPAPGHLDPGLEVMKDASDDLRNALKALEDRDDIAAGQSLAKAVRRIEAANERSRGVLGDSTDRLSRVVEMSGFEYAPRQAFALLLVYLEMQRAYADRDDRQLEALSARFNEAYQETVRVTLAEKQRRLEELGAEVATHKEEIRKTAEASVLEIYPGVYVVKKGDTLPGIAARHDIYNDSFMWPLIYKANRDQIKDPKVLYAGQDLKIPRDMSVEEIVEARREAGAPEPGKIPKEAYMPKRRK